MEPASLKPIRTCAEEVRFESPRCAKALLHVYQTAVERKCSARQAVTLSKNIFKSQDFFYHPASRRAYRRFCEAYGMTKPLAKLIRCDRNETTRSFYLGEPVNLDVETALKTLRIAFEDRAQELVRYCADWLVTCLSFDINNGLGEPAAVHIDYYKQIFDDVARTSPKLSEDSVFKILEAACACECREPEFGFSKISAPSLELAAILWLAKKGGRSLETLVRYLRWAYRNRNEMLTRIATGLFANTHRSFDEMAAMFRFAAEECRIPVLQTVCMVMASKFDPQDYPAAPKPLFESARRLWNCRENTNFELNSRYQWRIHIEDEWQSPLGVVLDQVENKGTLGRLDCEVVYKEMTPYRRKSELMRSANINASRLAISSKVIGVLPSVVSILFRETLREVAVTTGSLSYHDGTILSIIELSNMPALRKATLQLGDEATVVLFGALLNKIALECLEITIPDEEKCAENLCKHMARNRSIRCASLSFSKRSRVPIGDLALEAFVGMLRENAVLRRIRLSHWNLSFEQKAAVLEALEENSSLEILEGFREGCDPDGLKKRMNRFHYRAV